MTEWILIIALLAAGPAPASLTTIPGFYTQKDCHAAGQVAVDRLKEVTFACVNR